MSLFLVVSFLHGVLVSGTIPLAMCGFKLWLEFIGPQFGSARQPGHKPFRHERELVIQRKLICRSPLLADELGVDHEFQQVAVRIPHVHAGGSFLAATLAFDWTFNDLSPSSIQHSL